MSVRAWILAYIHVDTILAFIHVDTIITLKDSISFTVALIN